MTIHAFPSGPFATNAYLIVCPRTSKAVVIDPAPGSLSSLLDCIRERSLHVEKMILTHSHWDHFGDAAAFLEQISVPVYIHELDAPNLMHPGQDGLPMFHSISPVMPSHFLKEGEEVRVGDLVFRVMHTPGHSPGGVCLYCSEEQILMSGDTLFQGSIGNLSFPTANAEEMWTSLDRLAHLPPETRVYPGHGESTTIGQESWLPRARQIFGES